MGHTEMCLAVAGLKQEEINDTTRRLAGDWSTYAFRFDPLPPHGIVSVTIDPVPPEEAERLRRG